MKLTEDFAEVLEDLIKINRDRVEAYKRASYDTSVSDLKDIFRQMADESRKNITDLTKEIMIINQHQEPMEIKDEDKIYADWKEIPLKFVHRDSNTFLNLCEFSESTIINAYQQAISKLEHSLAMELVKRQEESLKASLEAIKAYRKVYTRVISD